jgi:7-carboxy-7-deazaguanine synthase
MDRLWALRAPPDALVVLSGGNPALHHLDGLIAALHARGKKVSIETQGSVWRDWIADCDRIVVSPKPPSSGMATDRHLEQTERFMKNIYRRALWLRTAVKIVCFDEVDLDWAAQLAGRHGGVPLYLSAGTTQGLGEVETKEAVLERYRWLAEAVLRHPDLARAKVLPQLHCLIWGPARGV